MNRYERRAVAVMATKNKRNDEWTVKFGRCVMSEDINAVFPCCACDGEARAFEPLSRGHGVVIAHRSSESFRGKTPVPVCESCYKSRCEDNLDEIVERTKDQFEDDGDRISVKFNRCLIESEVDAVIECFTCGEGVRAWEHDRGLLYGGILVSDGEYSVSLPVCQKCYMNKEQTVDAAYNKISAMKAAMLEREGEIEH